MNFYLLVEGDRTEKKLYPAWLSLTFATMRQVWRIEDLQGDHFVVFAFKGQPLTPDKLTRHVEDVVSLGRIDHFFVMVDAEEESSAVRQQSIDRIIRKIPGHDTIHYSIIVQNRCIETWFLGNRRFMKRNPQSEELRAYQNHYPVHEQDPELMPKMANFTGTHAGWHKKYLEAIFKEQNLTYNKEPYEVNKPSYFYQLYERVTSTPHLPSLKRLLDQWHGLGGTLPGYPAPSSPA
ncbi:MAG: hypothetical protein HQL96_00425 [Magnetococcales bacterium]|nr:hypothetical protein [Magnetococcales bacterium]